MEIPNAVYLQGSSSNAVSEEAASMETVLADTVVLMADEEAIETMRRPAQRLNNDSPKQQSPQARKKVSTRRHLDDSNLCPFRLSIFMISEASSTDGGRWFLSTPKGAPTSTCGCHSGHIQMDPSLLHNYISGLSSRDTQLAKQCAHLGRIPGRAYSLSRADFRLCPRTDRREEQRNVSRNERKASGNTVPGGKRRQNESRREMDTSEAQQKQQTALAMKHNTTKATNGVSGDGLAEFLSALIQHLFATNSKIDEGMMADEDQAKKRKATADPEIKEEISQPPNGIAEKIEGFLGRIKITDDEIQRVESEIQIVEKKIQKVESEIFEFEKCLKEEEPELALTTEPKSSDELLQHKDHLITLLQQKNNLLQQQKDLETEKNNLLQKRKDLDRENIDFVQKKSNLVQQKLDLVQQKNDMEIAYTSGKYYA
ncbi:hypothetical protein IV203_027286 [Nitzschia inconspicua]|uniref:Uncharacterized protein n=1 Tax=Nitzschia inconspicua TaxID=303405 RepID=A0A9K3LXE9_9STRA|nr:hypothetical protein IV203_027286 [Nitzschia inconspicua]